MILEPFLTVYSGPSRRKTVQTVSILILVADHRAKATVSMKSLCLTDVLVRPEPVHRLVAAWLHSVSVVNSCLNLQ
jgi:hypothetical protein